MTEITKFRKKPVEIEAIQINSIEDARTAAHWIRKAGSKCMFNETIFNNGGGILIDTLEGSMIAKQSDYVIKGVENEFYPCRSDIFDKTYEEV